MGKKYDRLLAPDSVDSRYAFEVVNSGVITYDRKVGGFLGQKFNYAVKYSYPITHETTINLRLFNNGGGMCELVTGKFRADFYIHRGAQEFADEVKAQIDTLSR